MTDLKMHQFPHVSSVPVQIENRRKNSIKIRSTCSAKRRNLKMMKTQKQTSKREMVKKFQFRVGHRQSSATYFVRPTLTQEYTRGKFERNPFFIFPSTQLLKIFYFFFSALLIQSSFVPFSRQTPHVSEGEC